MWIYFHFALTTTYSASPKGAQTLFLLHMFKKKFSSSSVTRREQKDVQKTGETEMSITSLHLISIWCIHWLFTFIPSSLYLCTFFIFSPHALSSSFVKLCPLTSSPPYRPSFFLWLPLSYFLCNEIQMSLLDLPAPQRDQKAAATLLKSPVPLSLSFSSLTHLHSHLLVNLKTLIPVYVTGNFYAKHVHMYSLCVITLAWWTD